MNRVLPRLIAVAVESGPPNVAVGGLYATLLRIRNLPRLQGVAKAAGLRQFGTTWLPNAVTTNSSGATGVIVVVALPAVSAAVILNRWLANWSSDKPLQCCLLGNNGFPIQNCSKSLMS